MCSPSSPVFGDHSRASDYCQKSNVLCASHSGTSKISGVAIVLEHYSTSQVQGNTSSRLRYRSLRLSASCNSKREYGGQRVNSDVSTKPLPSSEDRPVAEVVLLVPRHQLQDQLYARRQEASLLGSASSRLCRRSSVQLQDLSHYSIRVVHATT